MHERHRLQVQLLLRLLLLPLLQRLTAIKHPPYQLTQRGRMEQKIIVLAEKKHKPETSVLSSKEPEKTRQV